MCGIIASASKSNVLSDVLKSLNRLEYRGYDSAGVAYLDSNLQIHCHKYKGMVAVLESKVDANFPTCTAIGHTRWATHGEPSDVNSHPHVNEDIALVHNGIIENYAMLKEGLIKKGYTFKSQTDTEVALVLLTDICKTQSNKVLAIKELISKLEGSFALAMIFKGDTKIYGTKRNNPMIVGFNPKEEKHFIASDIYAIVDLAVDSAYLEDNEIAVMSSTNAWFYDHAGQEITKVKQAITINNKDISKGEFPSYMLKEIYDQRGCLSENIKNHYDAKNNTITLPQIKQSLANIKYINIVSCGTSYNAGLIAKNWFEKYCGVTVSVELSSEFTYKHNNSFDDSLYIYISQSGETADTMASVKKVNQAITEKKQSSNSFSIAIVNIVESQIARLCNYVIPCFCGAEIAVASTKSFTASLTSLMFLCLKMAEEKKLLTKAEITNIYNQHIQHLPSKLTNLLDSPIVQDQINKVRAMAAKHLNNNLKIIWLGRNIFYGLAIESCLKTQELCYLPTLALPLGELKHGPISILDEQTMVICLEHEDFLMKKTAATIEEISSRKANIVLISNKNHNRSTVFIDTAILGEFHDMVSPIAYAPIVHLISYQLADLMGRNIDKPRGLAKAVTVE